MPTRSFHIYCRPGSTSRGVGDVAMLIDQRITGVAPQKFDRHVELVPARRRVAVISGAMTIASVRESTEIWGFTAPPA